MDIGDFIALITVALMVLGIIVGLTRYIIQLQYQTKIELLESKCKQEEKDLANLRSDYKKLTEEIAIAQKIGSSALIKKREIEEDLKSLMKSVGAERGSVYIPYFAEAAKAPSGLVFLCMHPFVARSKTLKRRIIPIRSMAGRCYRLSKHFISKSPAEEPEHYSIADKLMDYDTQDTLNFPLEYESKVIGVLQLINKKGDSIFDEPDLEHVRKCAPSLSTKVHEFLCIPKHLEILGIIPPKKAEDATIMFCDLTQSSLLFQETITSQAILYLNEYIEKICDVGLLFGATIDKYMGDGVLLRFNVPKRVDNAATKAVQAALEMNRVFDELKNDWSFDFQMAAGFFNRTGIASGPIHYAVVGHSQTQALTVLGPSVNVAISLCDIASRRKNSILIDEATYQKLTDKRYARIHKSKELGKAGKFTKAVYEIRELA